MKLHIKEDMFQCLYNPLNKYLKSKNIKKKKRENRNENKALITGIFFNQRPFIFIKNFPHWKNEQHCMPNEKLNKNCF